MLSPKLDVSIFFFSTVLGAVVVDSHFRFVSDDFFFREHHFFAGQASLDTWTGSVRVLRPNVSEVFPTRSLFGNPFFFSPWLMELRLTAKASPCLSSCECIKVSFRELACSRRTLINFSVQIFPASPPPRDFCVYGSLHIGCSTLFFLLPR